MNAVRSDYTILLIFSLVIILVSIEVTNAVEFDFSGQLSGWSMVLHDDIDWRNQNGLRYIPELYFKHGFDDEQMLEFQLSVIIISVCSIPENTSTTGNTIITTSDQNILKSWDITIYTMLPLSQMQKNGTV